MASRRRRRNLPAFVIVDPTSKIAHALDWNLDSAQDGYATWTRCALGPFERDGDEGDDMRQTMPAGFRLCRRCEVLP